MKQSSLCNQFHKMSIWKRRKLSQEQLEQYWVDYRIDQYERGDNRVNINGRRFVHPLLLSIAKIGRFLEKEKMTVIKDERVKINGPIIYASTHIGGHDIERCFEAIKDHAFLFLGDPKELYRNASGVLLFLNGVICLETRNKYDRKIAKHNAIEVLKHGGNLLIYPEEVWNISENKLVNKIFMGTASIALKANATVVPMAIEQYGKQFYVNIGRNIEVSTFRSDEISKLTELIWEKLAELKLEILEYNGVVARDSLDKNLKRNWVDSIFPRADFSYTVEDIYETQMPEDYDKPEEVFAFMEKLQPKRENAFC